MSILANIVSAIWGRAGAQTAQPSAPPGSEREMATAPAEAPVAPAAPDAPAAPAASPLSPQSSVDVAAILNDLAAQRKQKLDWRKSIVDLMKLLDLDSSLSARKKLAQELHYTGDMKDSAAMNVWLHKQVMKKLAENGGKVPAELRQG
jgi:hypothetical protein